MNTIDFIKTSLETSKGWTLTLITDMKDSPFTLPTPNGGNHPLWLLGHIVHSESNLFDVFVQGQSNRFPELQNLFEMGSTPSTDPTIYPSMDDLLEKFESIRADVLAHLDTLTDSDLDNPSHAPEEFGQGFSTVGGCFSAMIIHPSFHAGQVADARRAAGRPYLFGQPETA